MFFPLPTLSHLSHCALYSHKKTSISSCTQPKNQSSGLTTVFTSLAPYTKNKTDTLSQCNCWGIVRSTLNQLRFNNWHFYTKCSRPNPTRTSQYFMCGYLFCRPDIAEKVLTGDITWSWTLMENDLPLLERCASCLCTCETGGATAMTLAAQHTAEKGSKRYGDDKRGSCMKTIHPDSSNKAAKIYHPGAPDCTRGWDDSNIETSKCYHRQMF